MLGALLSFAAIAYSARSRRLTRPMSVLPEEWVMSLFLVPTLRYGFAGGVSGRAW